MSKFEIKMEKLANEIWEKFAHWTPNAGHYPIYFMDREEYGKAFTEIFEAGRQLGSEDGFSEGFMKASNDDWDR